MGFDIIYKKLLQVECRQNYYLNKGAEEFASLSDSEQQEMLENYRRTYSFTDDFRVLPTSETQRALSGLGLLLRTASTGFFVGAPVEELPGDRYTLRRPPTAPVRFRFTIRLSTPAFMNYTNLSLHNHRQKIYYFSNLPQQRGYSRTFPSLSHIPRVYVEGTSYQAGDVVRRTANNSTLYLSVEKGTHEHPPANPGESSPWNRLSGRNYVTSDDRVSLYPPLFSFVFPEATVVEAKFKIIADDGNEYDAGDIAAPAGKTLLQHSLDLRALATGRYRLDVEGVNTDGDPYTHTEEIYIDPELPAQSIFGLIEIFHSPVSTEDDSEDAETDSEGPDDDYSLIDADRHLRHPEYVIHFLNRYTFWRYLFGTAPDPTPDDSDFDRIDDRQYVSKEPLPLTNSFIPLRADGVRLLPNPTTHMIKRENNRFYSHIRVHP